MAWWQESDFRGYLDEVLTHVNEATDASKASPATRMCDLYFHALNKLWNAFGQHEGKPGRADTPSFISLLQSVSEDSRSILLNSPVLKNLVDLTPEVLDHFVLKSRGYRPGQEITAPLRRDATEKHRKLVGARQLVRQDGGRVAHFTVRNRCNLPRRAHQLASARESCETLMALSSQRSRNRQLIVF